MRLYYTTPHVALLCNEHNQPIIVIDDHVVFDYVEDILIDQHGIGYQHYTEEINSTSNTYKMFFDPKTDINNLHAALRTIDLREVEKLYRVNHPN